MASFLDVLVAVVLDSLAGLVGIFSLYVSEETLNRIVEYMVAFAAGAMLAGALVHLFPKALSLWPHASILTIVGFASFFLLERVLHWHHCHEMGVCEVHPVTTLTIIGDAIHNFIDGIVMAASFLVGTATGWITTALVVGHEVPQELGNFSVLIYGGYEKKRAIAWTFFSQATCIFGGIVGWFFMPLWLRAPLLAFAAGGFLYIAASDLVPELHKGRDLRKSMRQFLIFLAGAAFMIIIKVIAH